MIIEGVNALKGKDGLFLDHPFIFEYFGYLNNSIERRMICFIMNYILMGNG